MHTDESAGNSVNPAVNPLSMLLMNQQSAPFAVQQAILMQVQLASALQNYSKYDGNNDNSDQAKVSSVPDNLQSDDNSNINMENTETSTPMTTATQAATDVCLTSQGNKTDHLNSPSNLLFNENIIFILYL